MDTIKKENSLRFPSFKVRVLNMYSTNLILGNLNVSTIRKNEQVR
jgi:hypothetical protein